MSAMTATTKTLLRETGSARHSNIDQILQLFQFPGLRNLATALEHDDAQRSPRGRPCDYPVQALLTVAACARVTGSLPSALTLLREGDLWEQCRAIYLAMHGVTLPIAAPTRHHIQYLYARVTTRESALRALLGAFVEASVKQAQLLGNLIPGAEPDWSEFDARHTIFGDGTILKPFSDVVAVTHPLTGRPVAHGSRAASFETARIQWETRKAGVDEKSQAGINHGWMHTETEAGGVVLALGLTLMSELPMALDLIDMIMAAAGNGVHTLVHDMLITGWAVDYLMAHHRVQVLGKVPQRRIVNDPEWLPTIHLTERVAALAAEAHVPVNALTTPVLRERVLNDMNLGHRLGRVGTSVYPKKSVRSAPDRGPGGDGRPYDVIHGYFAFLQADHRLPDGATCSHDLVLDDGALFTVGLDEYGEELVKTTHLRCTSATPFRTPTHTWGTRSTYTVPCEHGDFTYTRTYTPPADRHRAPGGELPDPIGNRLRPIPRADAERFAHVERDRNAIESSNAWYKRSLPGKRRERAASISAAGQQLDFLLGAVLNNALTWANAQGR